MWLYEGSEVWGVVYELSDSDLARLDDSEGYHEDRKVNAYVRREGTVLPGGDEEKPMQVWIYFAVRQKNPPLPNAEYKALIVNGARFWGLPPEYVRTLEGIQTQD